MTDNNPKGCYCLQTGRDPDMCTSSAPCALLPYLRRIEELENRDRWIPVTERLPEDGVYVLTCGGSSYFEVDCLRFGTKIFEQDIASPNSPDKVHHWKPINPPEESK